jgi:hypothetical protein
LSTASAACHSSPEAPSSREIRRCFSYGLDSRLMVDVKARIFLSSGQIEGTPEVDLVRELQRRLADEFGFVVTIGTGTNATAGVAGEVFRRLREAEYFILVDFARGSVSGEPPGGASFRRGSLFSEQELAVAIFRGLRYLVFQEEGMLLRDGILRHVASDPTLFNRGNLIESVLDRVREEVGSRQWDPAWRNELSLSRQGRGPDTPSWVRYGDEGKLNAKYFHVEVENRHRDQIATGVHAYLESWVDRSRPNVVNHPPLVELKFSGVRTRAVSIPPRSRREFDGAFVFAEAPGHAWVGLNTFLRDWTGLDELYHFEGVNREIDLNFIVFSDQFGPASKRLTLRIGPDGSSTELIDAEMPPAPGLGPTDNRPDTYPTGSGVTHMTVETGTINGRTTVDPRLGQQ